MENVNRAKRVEEPLHVEDVPVDLVDPHRAALDHNPDRAERPSLSTILAVVVGTLEYLTPIPCN